MQNTAQNSAYTASELGAGTMTCSFGRMSRLGADRGLCLFASAGIEDLDSDEAVVFPVDGGEAVNGWGCQLGSWVRPGGSESPVRWM